MTRPIKKTIIPVFAALMMSSTGIQAQTIAQADNNNLCGAHTWHQVSTPQGDWSARLLVVNQQGSFVNEQCEEITEFNIRPGEPFTFGMRFGDEADFNFAYSLTLVHQDSKAIKKPICHYFVSAMGPGVPQIIPSWINNPSFCNVLKEKLKTDFAVG